MQLISTLPTSRQFSLCGVRSDNEHVNLREAFSVVQVLKWILCSLSCHCSKLVLLVDSRVVVGANTKGGSGSPTLNILICRVACLSMLGGLVLHVVSSTLRTTRHSMACAAPRAHKNVGADLPGLLCHRLAAPSPFAAATPWTWPLLRQLRLCFPKRRMVGLG